MSQTTIGLYSGEGEVIVEYNEFDATDIQYLNIATGFGSDGTWRIQPSTCPTPSKYIHTPTFLKIVETNLFFRTVRKLSRIGYY